MKLSLTVIIFFVIFFYSIAGYIILLGIRKKKYVPIFIKNLSCKSSTFYFLAWNISLRHLLMGFAHGFLYDSPETQTYCILILNLLSLLLVTFFWRNSISRISNILLSLYNFCKIILDSCLLNGITVKYDLEEVEYYLIVSLMLSLLFMFFWEVTIILRKVISELEEKEDQFE